VNNSGYKACKGMQQKVAAIKAEEKDELKIMMALQNLVMNEMQTYHVNMMETGFRLRTPAEVWKSNGGTKLEKTCLLTALLLQANINAKAIAVIPEKFYDPQMGNLLAVQDFVIQVNPKQHGQFYISATAHANKNLKQTFDFGGCHRKSKNLRNRPTSKPDTIWGRLCSSGRWQNPWDF
jgi:hypothetical protein